MTGLRTKTHKIVRIQSGKYLDNFTAILDSIPMFIFVNNDDNDHDDYVQVKIMITLMPIANIYIDEDDDCQTPPPLPVTNATYTVMRELRESKGNNSGN